MGFLKRLFQHRPPDSAKTLDRNAPCWCGSKKRYEDCHYDDDRVYFMRQEHRSPEQDACRGFI